MNNNSKARFKSAGREGKDTTFTLPNGKTITVSRRAHVRKSTVPKVGSHTFSK
jgi:hypothetical protein